MSNYFVMMNNQKGTHIIPLVDDNDEVALYEEYEDAESDAINNPYAVAFGYSIFNRWLGE